MRNILSTVLFVTSLSACAGKGLSPEEARAGIERCHKSGFDASVKYHKGTYTSHIIVGVKCQIPRS